LACERFGLWDDVKMKDSGGKTMTTTQLEKSTQLQYVSDAAGNRVGVIVPIALWRAIEAQVGSTPANGSDSETKETPAKKPRVSPLHPGAMVMSDDFNDELPDEFWLGDENDLVYK
jgi:hypothetical protein